MPVLPNDLQYTFFKVLCHETSLLDFEKWLYSHEKLEQQLGNEIYLDLISLNFKDKHVLQEVHKIMAPFLDAGKNDERKLKALLHDLIHRTDDFTQSLIETYHWYCSGYDFLYGLGMTYGLVLIEAFFLYNDWVHLTGEGKEAVINRLHPSVKVEAELIRNLIETNQIKLTGEVANRRHRPYIDHRTSTTITPAALRKITADELKRLVLT